MRKPPWRRSLASTLSEVSVPSPNRSKRKLISKVEALENRNLMAVASPVLPPTPITTPSTTASEVQAMATPSAGPAVAFVQFEPLTGRVLVSFSGDLAGYNTATLTNPANYSFTPVELFSKLPTKPESRPRAGVVLAPEFAVTGANQSGQVPPGEAQTVIVSINNNQPIKNGIYEFAINAPGITDLAGRELDGQYNGVFPSGNGQPGSDFVSLLTEVNNTVLPASPASPQPETSTQPTVAPTFVFLPTVQRIVVGYRGSTPGRFMLAGGNHITLTALNNQFFPGSFRPKPAKPATDHGSAKK
jgi:hypothetical protein